MLRFVAKIWNIIWSYLCDKEQTYSRIIHIARLSMLVNAAIGIGKIIMGLYNLSFLFIFSGLYNIGICLAKAVAVKGYAESKCKRIWPFKRPAHDGLSRKSKKKEYRYFRQVGVIILLASVAYMVGSIGVLVGERSSAHFSTFMVAQIGIITAVEIVVALQGVLARRQEKEPILEALKFTSFISSLIGLVLVQTAILGHSGGTPIVYFDYAGIFLGAVSVCIGVYMIVSANMKLLCRPFLKITDRT